MREEAVDAPREALERRGVVVAVVVVEVVFLMSRVAAEDEEVRRRVLRERGLEPPSAEVRQGPALGVEGPGLDVRRQFASDDVELVALGEGQAVHGANHIRVRERLGAQRLPQRRLVGRDHQHERLAGGFEVQRLACFCCGARHGQCRAARV